MEQFTQIIRLLLKNAILLAIMPILAMVGLYHMTKDTPSQYEVKAKFLFDFGGKSTNISGEALNQQQINTEFLNAVEIIKSNRLIEKIKTTAAHQSLTGETDVFPFDWDETKTDAIKIYLEEILNNVRKPYLDGSAEADEIHRFYEKFGLESGRILDAIHARRLMNSNFLEIKMSYTNNDELYFIINTLTQLLVKEIGSLNKVNIGRQKSVIAELVKKAKGELDQKVQELENLKVENNIINLGEHTKAIVGYQVQLEGLKSNLRTQIASAKKGEKTIKEGITNEEFTKSQSPDNIKILRQKEKIYTAQDLKLNHLQKNLDYSELLKQEQVINQNRLGIQSNLSELSQNAVYNPDMINTDLTMQFINYKIESDRLLEELNIIESEISRVKQYAAYFAPFESQISSLRDEISTAQQTYLLFLNKLNITESLELSASSSKLELVDPPKFPRVPLPSKTKLIIVAGGVAVFILLVAFIVIVFLLDNSIKDVKTFERRFNESIVAALPIVPKKTDPIQSDALRTVQSESIKKIVKVIGDYKVITINSLSKIDDPSEIIKDLKKYWRREKVGIVVLTGELEVIKNKIEEKLKKYTKLLCISQPLQFSGDGITAAEASDVSFLHFSLGRLKTSVDERVLRDYKDVYNHKGFILSHLQPEFMDSYVGELPKQRHFIRRFIKKLLNRDLLWKK